MEDKACVDVSRKEVGVLQEGNKHTLVVARGAGKGLTRGEKKTKMKIEPRGLRKTTHKPGEERR